MGVDKSEDEEEENESKEGRRISLFGVYSKVFKVMLSNWKESIEHTEEEDRVSELDELVLPSNEEWRYQVYYRLVDLQREVDSTFDKEISDEDIDVEVKSPVLKDEVFWEWEPIAENPEDLIRNSPDILNENLAKRQEILRRLESPEGSMTEAYMEPGWRLNDILHAAKVLQGESLPQQTSYNDEVEMRRVFGLVYDVLRYKQILNQVLEDVGFWINNRELKKRERIVWLLLFDMQGRKFMSPPQIALTEMRQELFKAAGLMDIEEALLKNKIKIAAGVSRLRIGGSALTLDKLLPAHLRNEGICWTDDEASASGWVNTIKLPTKAEFMAEMTKMGFKLSANWRRLKDNNYAFDPICPKVVILHEKIREQLARSTLVREYRFIFLERSLCFGAASLAKTIRVSHLCGPIILTHLIAPRHTGYLAGLLIDIEDAGRLLAFGAESRRAEYEAYLANLGINEKQCRIFSESYKTAPGFAELERSTVVLATPPCSYTGLTNIVDLIVARGGDTDLLESLTNVDDQAQLERPRKLLAEQMTCLKYILTRPNVQLLIYEAHSTLPSETVEMLQQVVQYANKMAVDKHTREHLPRKRTPTKDSSPKSGGRSSRSGKRPLLQESRTKSSGDEDDEEEISSSPVPQVQVPDSDLFEIGNIFELYGHHNNEQKEVIDNPLAEDGCYLAVVRRKEMMQFNSLFMIKVAESKGLFGNPQASKSPVPEQQSREETSPTSPTPTMPTAIKKLKKGKGKGKKKIVRLDRITAPTHSSMLKVGSRRTSRHSRQSIDNESCESFSVSSVRLSCPRYSERVARDERFISFQVRETRRQDVRRWWEQSATFLIHAARCEPCKFRIFHTDPWTKRVLYAPRVQQIVFPHDDDDLH
ncbi:Similar to Nsun7: Putative methyltransferase NSUN7 (Mus musculus) [Cotesia congregata]|uniref:Similar to Nsun7: Putative methyltransferase NSUN7 (Mus musculus) n=1 Tax=Cotesia congregata TaxID=51543 RepID=A0A8J2H7R4_COTCN|nr:Similar to Nsun7: Putative methyltransferase NSUN7 (Mus musculus) [Cotesia congregata]